MQRPLPTHPRGPRRARPVRPRRFLALPRVSPEWELGALKTLMKPQAGDAIRHRSGDQPRPVEMEAVIAEVTRLIADRLAVEFRPHLPAEGDYWMMIDFAAADLPAALAFGMLLSQRLAGSWLVLDRLFLCDGTFFRRQRGYKLKLVPATNVHLARGVRAALQGIGKKESEEDSSV